jgi:sigma-B regulation protein RsbU (phosphoserine phosphatase)
MALTRAYLRSFAAIGLEIHDILTQINKMLLADLEHGHYVTLSLARLSPQERTFQYASAGHVPGFVLGRSGELKRTLESTGPPLGLFSDSTFTQQPTIELVQGEIVLLLTDGVTESTSPEGEEFGWTRALHHVQTQSSKRSQQIVNGLYQAARDFVNNEPQGDDMTSIVMKVQPGEAG